MKNYLDCKKIIDENEIKEIAKDIKEGKGAVFPTETVYGLGGNALSPDASRAIYAAKGRPSDNPLIVHIYRIEDLYEIVEEVSENAKKVLAFSLRGGDLGYKIGINSYVIKVKDKLELYKALKEDIVSAGLDISKLIDAERYTPYTKIREIYPEAEMFAGFIRACEENY